MPFAGKDWATRSVVPALKSGRCKLKIISKSRLPQPRPGQRKPWDPSTFKGLSRSTKTTRREFSCAVPTPDCTCLPASQVTSMSEGAVQEKQVLLCQENWRPAVWAYGPRNEITMRRCHKWGPGRSTTTVELLPNDYRRLHIYESTEADQPGMACLTGRPLFCEIKGGADNDCTNNCPDTVTVPTNADTGTVPTTVQTDTMTVPTTTQTDTVTVPTTVQTQ